MPLEERLLPIWKARSSRKLDVNSWEELTE
jgi:hypothetical protein